MQSSKTIIPAMLLLLTAMPAQAGLIDAELTGTVSAVEGMDMEVGGPLTLSVKAYTEPKDFGSNVRRDTNGWSGNMFSKTPVSSVGLNQCKAYANKTGKKITGMKTQYGMSVLNSGYIHATGRTVVDIGSSRLTKVSFDGPVQCTISYSVNIDNGKATGLMNMSIYQNGSVNAGRVAVDKDGNAYRGAYSTHKTIMKIQAQIMEAKY